MSSAPVFSNHHIIEATVDDYLQGCDPILGAYSPSRQISAVKMTKAAEMWP
jgi:hypothetical protein